jgi:hypothetical protein
MLSDIKLTPGATPITPPEVFPWPAIKEATIVP